VEAEEVTKQANAICKRRGYVTVFKEAEVRIVLEAIKELEGK